MSNTFASRLAEAEKTESAKAAGSRVALKNASALVGSCEEALDEANSKVGAIRVSWQRHSEEYAAGDFAVALAEVERCSERRSGAEAGLKYAERALISDDAAVASAIRELIEAVIPSTPIYHTFIKDGSVQPETRELPLALVVQTTPTVTSKTGHMSGTVTLQFNRIDGLHQQLDMGKLKAKAQTLGVRMTAHATTPRKTAAGVVDECRITVDAIADAIPHMVKVEPYYTNMVGSGIASEALGPIKTRDEGIRVTPDLCHEVSAATLYRNRVEVVSMDVDQTGLRTTVIDVSILYKRHHSTQQSIPNLIDRAAMDMKGAFTNGVGRVSDVTKIDSDSALWMDASRFTLSRAIPSLAEKPLDGSKAGLESAGQCVYRITIESRTK